MDTEQKLEILRSEVRRLRDLRAREAMLGQALRAKELRKMLEDHAEMVYEALRSKPESDLREKYEALVRLCAVKRSYEVPPEYAGILNVEERSKWSPTNTEIARVMVAVTVAESGGCVLYADLVARIAVCVSTARSHIYRSLKVILRVTPTRGDVVRGLRLK
jgi:hypothetical protein